MISCRTRIYTHLDLQMNCASNFQGKGDSFSYVFMQMVSVDIVDPPMDLENISDLDLEADTPLDNEAVIKFQTCKDVH